MSFSTFLPPLATLLPSPLSGVTNSPSLSLLKSVTLSKLFNLSNHQPPGL